MKNRKSTNPKTQTDKTIVHLWLPRFGDHAAIQAFDQSQIANRTLRIGITGAYGGGRPSVQINGQPTTSQSATSQPSSRSFTIGTYRGNNKQLSYAIVAADLVVGTNTITMSPISGSSDLGTFLSASYPFDCLELY